MKILGIAGRIGAGKDTVADFICNQYGFTRGAFADRLKKSVALKAGEPVELYHDRAEKEKFCPALGMTRRSAMQIEGKWARDTYGWNVWVQALLAPWVRLGRPALVVSDVRYSNEAQAIRDQGGVILNIYRPFGAVVTAEAAMHESEAGIDKALITHEIVNDGTVDDLHRQIDAFMREQLGI